MKVLQFPLARITLFFIMGIVAAYELKPASPEIFWIVFTGFLACIIFWLYTQKQLIQKSYFGISLYCFSFAVGLATYTAHNLYVQKGHYTNQLSDTGGHHTLKIIIREKLRSTAYKERYIAEVKAMDAKPSNGLILLNIEREKHKGKD